MTAGSHWWYGYWLVIGGWWVGYWWLVGGFLVVGLLAASGCVMYGVIGQSWMAALMAGIWMMAERNSSIEAVSYVDTRVCTHVLVHTGLCSPEASHPGVFFLSFSTVSQFNSAEIQLQLQLHIQLNSNSNSTEIHLN